LWRARSPAHCHGCLSASPSCFSCWATRYCAARAAPGRRTRACVRTCRRASVAKREPGALQVLWDTWGKVRSVALVCGIVSAGFMCYPGYCSPPSTVLVDMARRCSCGATWRRAPLSARPASAPSLSSEPTPCSARSVLGDTYRAIRTWVRWRREQERWASKRGHVV